MTTISEILRTAKAVRRSKNQVIVKAMDEVKSSLEKAGWKHRQMESVDTYTRQMDGAKAEKEIAAILKPYKLVGFHNREENNGMVEVVFEHRLFSKFMASLKYDLGSPQMVLYVGDHA